MSRKTKKAWLRTLSGLTINLSAGWFGLVLITPNFTDLSKIDGFIVLLGYLFLGIIFLFLTAFIERLNYE